jgi:predicted ester cyclase
MSVANEVLIGDFLHQCANSSIEGAIERYCADEFVLHDTTTGQDVDRAAVTTILQSWRTAFPDARVEVRKCVANGDDVEAHWRWVGTHQGAFFGIAGTGIRRGVSGAAICRVQNHTIREAWLLFDVQDFLQTLAASADESRTSPDREQVGRRICAEGYTEIGIGTWREFVEHVSGGEFQNWAFRGQEDATWPMESSLSRYLKKRVHKSLWEVQEERIIRIFRRKAHLFLQRLPAREDTFEWLALMQHHGAPTRLLDFTWSPYVAAFFALEHAAGKAAVWAIRSRTLIRQRLPPHMPERIVDGVHVVSMDVNRNFERLYLPGTLPVVVIADPEMMNQRLIAQQGTFLIPGRLDKPLERILPAFQDGDPIVVKFVLHAAVRDEAMREMLNMNITNATLFPGLDGLARSMTYELEFHWDYNPKTGERL